MFVEILWKAMKNRLCISSEWVEREKNFHFMQSGHKSMNGFDVSLIEWQLTSHHIHHVSQSILQLWRVCLSADCAIKITVYM